MLRERGIVVLAWTALLTFVVVTVGPALPGDKAFFPSDLLMSFAPWRTSEDRVSTGVQNPWLGDVVDAATPAVMLTASGARAGGFVQWDPYTAGGQALGGLPNNAAFSPLSLPWFVLPATWAPAAVKLLEILVITIGMCLLLRRWRLAPASWPLASLAYASSGFIVAWTGWPQTRVAALIPLLFWAADRAAIERRWRDVVGVALVLAAMLLGGFPAVTAYSLYAVVPFAVVRAAAVRLPARQAVRGAFVLGAGLLGGFGLAAWQLVPFLYQTAGVVDFDVRKQTPNMRLDLGEFLTAVAPDALGGIRGWWGPSNPIEGLSYLGLTVVLLALVALVLGRHAAAARGVVPYAAVASGVCLLLIYIGGIPLWLVQLLPVFSDNMIGRLRVMLGFFVALLAAAGLTALLRRASSRDRSEDYAAAPRPRHRTWLSWGAVVLSVAVLLGSANRAFVLATPEQRDEVGRVLLGGLPVALVVIAAITVLLLVRAAVAQVVAVGVTLAAVAVPAATLARDWWPITSASEFYPQTAAHEFLAEHLGEERFLGIAHTLVPSTASVYGVRSATGHTFHTQQWKDMLTAVDPDVMLTPTYSVFTNYTASAVASPLLDRLAVRYIVAPPGYPLLGESDEVPGDGVVSLPIGRRIDLGPVNGTVRGVAVDLVGQRAQGSVTMTATLLDADGGEVSISLRQVGSLEAESRVYFAFPDVLVEAGASVSLEITASADVTTVDARADDVGALAVAVYRAGGDLRLAFTEGVDVYERLSALPRVRWAGTAVVEDHAGERVGLLASGALPDDEVVLQNPGADPTAGSGASATVEVVRDGSGVIEVDVDAAGSGWLVVADSWGAGGWRASIDGTSAPTVMADHVGGAVLVPEGEHTVTFVYRTPGLRVGIAVTAATVVALALLPVVGNVVVSRLRRRLPEPGDGRAASAGPMDRSEP